MDINKPEILIPCGCSEAEGFKCDLHILEEIVRDKQELEAEYRKIADAKLLRDLKSSDDGKM